jgi:hypothetical protein
VARIRFWTAITPAGDHQPGFFDRSGPALNQPQLTKDFFRHTQAIVDDRLNVTNGTQFEIGEFQRDVVVECVIGRVDTRIIVFGDSNVF